MVVTFAATGSGRIDLTISAPMQVVGWVLRGKGFREIDGRYLPVVQNETRTVLGAELSAAAGSRIASEATLRPGHLWQGGKKAHGYTSKP